MIHDMKRIIDAHENGENRINRNTAWSYQQNHMEEFEGENRRQNNECVRKDNGKSS